MDFNLPTVNALTDFETLIGAAQSHRMLCDDENDYVVKFVNPNNKIVTNELVAGIIALDLGLPTPQRIFVNISRVVIEDSEEMPQNIEQLNPHIGSKVLPKEAEDLKKFSDGELEKKKLTNVDFLYGIVAFDNWVLNVDRDNRGNCMIIFLPRNKIRLDMIDYSHCFSGDSWVEKNLKTEINNKQLVPTLEFIKKKLTDTSKFEPWIKKIENFNDERINSIIENIPPSWGITGEEKSTLFKFLTARKNIVRESISSWKV